MDGGASGKNPLLYSLERSGLHCSLITSQAKFCQKKMDEKSRFSELFRAISEFIESEIQFYRKNLTLEASL